MLDCWMDPTDMYIAMEHGGSDLQTIMKTQKVSTEHVQFFGYQILRVRPPPANTLTPPPHTQTHHLPPSFPPLWGG